MGINESRGQQGRQYDRAELDGRLRESLSALIGEGNSFQDLSVARILTNAGVARSTFYMYYEDKIALLIRLAAHTLQRLNVALQQWIGRGCDATREEIRASMRLVLEEFVQDENIIRAMIEIAAYDERAGRIYHGAVLNYADALAEVIREGQRSGVMRRVEPAPTAESLAWMVERTVSMVNRRPPSRPRRGRRGDDRRDLPHPVRRFVVRRAMRLS